MELLIYYPMTCCLLQEQMKEVIIQHRSIIEDKFYNKYDCSYVEIKNVGPLRNKLLNGKPHGTIRCIGGSHGVFNRGKLIEYISDQFVFKDNKLTAKLYLHNGRYIRDRRGKERIFEFLIDDDGYLINTDHPKNTLMKNRYKRYKLKYLIGPACEIILEFKGYN